MKESPSHIEKDVLLQSVLSLARQFVKRQSIVLDAIRDLRPDWVIRAEGRIEAEFTTRDEWWKYVKKCMQNPQLGHWGKNKEWEYFLHGKGCRLKHVSTGEPIEWDMGNICTFDIFWFTNHVRWSIENENDLDAIVVKTHLLMSDQLELENLMLSVLDKLADAGMVQPNQYRNKHTLLVR